VSELLAHGCRAEVEAARGPNPAGAELGHWDELGQGGIVVVDRPAVQEDPDVPLGLRRSLDAQSQPRLG